MNITKDQKERFHFLDGLRGIASLMIVLLHSTGSFIKKVATQIGAPWIGSGYVNFMQSGVVLFFVLSGVVLLRPYLRRQRDFKMGDYFIRRAKRLYPPYFAALVFACFVIYFNNRFPTWYNIDGMRAQFSWLEAFKESFIISFTNSYYNLAWWSLGIEIVFYILAPFIILTFPKRDILTNTRIFIVMFITLAASVAAQLYLNRYYPAVYSYTYMEATVPRFIEYPLCFLMGVLLAAKDFKVRDAYLFIVLGIVLIIASFYYQPIVHSGLGLVYAAVIILSFNKPGLKRALSKPIMIWLGERSYSIFLIHFSVFYLMDNIISQFLPGRTVPYFILTRGLGLPVALFLAMLLFTFVEKRQARGLVTGDMFWPWQARSVKDIN